MVRLRAKVLGRLGRRPHPRASALSCPSLAIYGPGDPSEVRTSRPLAERRETVDVELGTNILGFPKAAYDVGIDGPRTEIVVNGYEDDSYEDVARQMCRALAVLGSRSALRPLSNTGPDKGESPQTFPNRSHIKGKLSLTTDYTARLTAKD